MSTVFSVSNDEGAVQNNAVCLSVNANRKHFPFDERERIKKRRKQLNPVRLSLEYVHGDETTDKDENTDADSEKHITYPYSTEPSTSFKSEPIEEKPDNEIQVPLNLTKNSRSEVKSEFEARQDVKPLFSPRKEEIRDVSKFVKNHIPEHNDTNYEHFMNAFQDEKIPKDQSPPFSPRTPPVSVMRSLFTNAVTRTSCRIFNPEAFCNICNKEFCNKYFLKTHKANKHGVYCENKDNVIDAETLPTNAVPLMFTWNVKNNNVKLPANPYLPNTNAVKDSSAFCNICEKEFCNKYFLRRHKEKMHGIVSFNESRKSDTSSDPENKCNNEIDDERDRMLNQMEDTKYLNFYHETKKNELNQNLKTDLLNKTVKDIKMKYPKYSSNATDAVSDFIKICLNNSVRSSHKSGPEERDLKSIYTESDSPYSKIKEENLVNLVKKEEHLSDYNCPNISSDRDVEQKPKCVSTGEFGVQAKEEDFHELENKKTATLFKQVKEENSTEDEERKFTCEFCKKSSSTYTIMKLHQKYVHGANVDENLKTDCDEESEFKRMENIYFMILKFSWLNTVVTFCEICKTEFEKNDILEMHLMNQHGGLVDEISRIIEDGGINGMLVPALNIGDGNLLCQICNKTFSNNTAFQQHVYEKCGLPDFKDYSDYFPNLSLDDAASDSSKTRNFCEICKKELCNKYFMKTHMRRMHGISIQNGVRIGGVTCEICNKELCSKYFLRVHKKNCHGIMENVQFARLITPEDKEDFPQKHVSQVCAICGRIFKSMKWLKTHLFNDHGKLGASVWQDILTSFNNDHFYKDDANSSTIGSVTDDINDYPMDNEIEEKPQLYQCSRCQFQASSVDILITHQRLHSKNTGEFQYRCMYCFIITKDKISLEEHIAYHHFTGSSADFQVNSKNEFGSRFTGKSMMDLDPQYGLGVTNGNCARVIDYDKDFKLTKFVEPIPSINTINGDPPENSQDFPLQVPNDIDFGHDVNKKLSNEEKFDLFKKSLSPT